MPTQTPKKTSSSPSHMPYHEVKTLLEWTAPGRPWRKRGKTYYATSLLIMFFIEVILFLFGEYLLMLVVLSLVFVAFALATVPPHDFHYRISTEGVFIEDHFSLWEELYDFYFRRTSGVNVLHVRSRTLIPGEFTLTMGNITEEQIKKAMLPYLPFREYIQPTFMDKSSEWLEKTFPLEVLKK